MPPVRHDHLRDLRDDKGVSNGAIAAGLDIAISPRYIENVMCGADDPSEKVIRSLARYFEIAPSDIRAEERSAPQGDPSEPPKQPVRPAGPDRRKDQRTGSGPRRALNTVPAA